MGWIRLNVSCDLPRIVSSCCFVTFVFQDTLANGVADRLTDLERGFLQDREVLPHERLGLHSSGVHADIDRRDDHAIVATHGHGK